MGEIAEAMLEGAMCEACGEWFEDYLAGEEPPGHPRRCAACSKIIRRRRRRLRSRTKRQKHGTTESNLLTTDS